MRDSSQPFTASREAAIASDLLVRMCNLNWSAFLDALMDPRLWVACNGGGVARHSLADRLLMVLHLVGVFDRLADGGAVVIAHIGVSRHACRPKVIE